MPSDLELFIHSKLPAKCSRVNLKKRGGGHTMQFMNTAWQEDHFKITTVRRHNCFLSSKQRCHFWREILRGCIHTCRGTRLSGTGAPPSWLFTHSHRTLRQCKSNRSSHTLQREVSAPLLKTWQRNAEDSRSLFKIYSTFPPLEVTASL